MLKSLFGMFGFATILLLYAAISFLAYKEDTSVQAQGLIEVYSKADSDIKFAKIESDLDFLARKVIEIDTQCVKKGKDELAK